MEKLLNEQVVGQIREAFANLTHPVQLLFFGAEENCEYCGETERLLTEISETDDKVGLTRQEFAGKVRGDRIEGSVRVTYRDDPEYKTMSYPWLAQRARTTAYFRPTGLAK
jgi:hypothetical protein